MALVKINPQTANRMTALVIGQAGIGKTSLLRTIPEKDRVCVLSAEAGLLCVRDLVQSGRVEGFEIGSIEDMLEAYHFLAGNEQAKERYRWVFIDSLTEIASRAVESAKAKYPSKADSFNLWGHYADQMTSIIKGFRDLQSFNVVFTCLPKQEKDEVNRIYYGPDISGSQLKDRLTSYFDEVFFYDMVKGDDGMERRLLITQPVNRYPGKDRSGKLDMYEAPDLAGIKTKIFGGK
jgi:hypothetical protein